MKDQTLLAMLLSSGELSEAENQAFRSMLSYIENPRISRHLSSRQRSWAEGVYRKLGLDKDEPSENLFSTGAVRKPAIPLPKLGWEKFPKPLKPPGR